jgi:hypothetical protein
MYFMHRLYIYPVHTYSMRVWVGGVSQRCWLIGKKGRVRPLHLLHLHRPTPLWRKDVEESNAKSSVYSYQFFAYNKQIFYIVFDCFGILNVILKRSVILICYRKELFLPLSVVFRGLQGDVVYLSWPIVPLSTSGEGGCGVSANENSCAHHVTWSPSKLWRSNSKFNLWLCCKVLTGKYYCSRIWPWPYSFCLQHHKVRHMFFEDMMSIRRGLFCILGVSQNLFDT